MPLISDVFAFAAQNADYWAEFLSGSDYPNELTEEEMRGLTAARAHVEEKVVELLHACGEQLADKLGPAKLAKPRPQPAVTARKRAVNLPSPTGLEGRLYGIQFSLEPNSSGNAVELFASLVVKKAALDALRQSLGERKIEHFVDNYHVYANCIPINAGDDVMEMAARSAQQITDLLSGFGDY